MPASIESIIVKEDEPCAPTPKTIEQVRHYGPYELRLVQQNRLDQHYYRYKQLPIDAIKSIR